MDEDTFLTQLQREAVAFTEAVGTEKGDWIVKGFIDVYKRIYTISVDTKVVSKILELLLFPKLAQYADRNGYQLVLAPEQNFYPDISFVSKSTKMKYALDIKSTYRTDTTTVNGMTLGAFTGYFRNRASRKNIVFPYSEYNGHFVLGVIYSKSEAAIEESESYGLEDLEKISSVIRDFEFFVQPKYRIASARPGSGNTKNIGSVTQIDQLVNGRGPFSVLGEDVYDDYWMYYLTKDMARAVDMERPYWNLKTYVEYKQRGANLDLDKIERLDQIDIGTEAEDAE
ncbi:MAG TPA: type II restriction endonuclease [Chloroflexia bacterium]|nr:type II restriction endonuclease [Chloroflexia bacterium]